MMEASRPHAGKAIATTGLGPRLVTSAWPIVEPTATPTGIANPAKPSVSADHPRTC